MERRIVISTKATRDVSAVISDENPKTADAIWCALPMKGSANRWGDEIYFSIPVSLSEEHARAEVEVGSVAYWPPGNALCIFFGATPASRHGEPRAYSPVNVFARIVGDTNVFKKVKDNDEISLNRFKQ
jgi:hypothetical protein